MTKIRTRFSDQVSRRGFLGAAAGAAALVAQPSRGAEGDVSWQLECRYTTGGAPYPPAFATMFTDPMFLSIQVGPNDLGATNSVTMPTRAGSGAPAGGGGRGRGRPRPFPDTVASHDMPPDIPVIPSGGAIGVGLVNISTYRPSVQLLNDQTDWAAASRESIQSAFDANQELIGTVVFHNAVADNQGWALWREELAGGLLVLDAHDGLKKSTVTRGVSYNISPTGSHPIVRDLPPFKVTGEDAYKGMWQSPKITPLLTATGSSTDRVVAWIGPNPGKARVVVIAPGTSPETFRNPAFRLFVRNAVLWVGHRLD